MKISSYWGFLFSITAGFLNSFAISIQKNVLDKMPDKYYYEKKWWAGFIMLISAEILGAASFSLLPSSIAVGLSSFAILGILFFARKKEPITTGFICGALSIITASFLNGLVTPPEKTFETFSSLSAFLTSINSIIFHTIILFICGLLHYFYIIRKIERYQLFGFAFYAACVSSITIIWARTFVTQIISIPNDCNKNHCNSTLKNWLLYVSGIVTGLTGLWAAGYIEQIGLTKNPQTVWFPIHFVSCVLTFSLAGVFIYDDWSVFNPSVKTVILLLYSLLLYVWGVFMITLKRDVMYEKLCYKL